MRYCVFGAVCASGAVDHASAEGASAEHNSAPLSLLRLVIRHLFVAIQRYSVPNRRHHGHGLGGIIGGLGTGGVR